MLALKRKRGAMAANINTNHFKFLNLWVPVFICMGFIFYASTIPGSNIPSLFPSQDIFFHMLAYIGLGFFFSRALKNTFSRLKRWHWVIFAACFGLLYGISDEFHQLFVPNRSVSGMDIFIDALGGLIGGLLYK